jgi:hypothetical protein
LSLAGTFNCRQSEGLSQQHLREFEAAGIQAELFNKDGRGLFAGQAVEIIDIHKLKDEMGDKTVAVESFESNNLVLIDEGHRGATAEEQGAWMRFRNALCEKGFSFEYSATFGQAIKSKPKFINLYAKCILFDYTYRYFYGDGFGKDYQILNLDEATQQQQLDTYLTACLLSFFQQQRLFREQEAVFRPFNIERPLLIFVGGSVTKTLASREASDVLAILLFLERYVSSRAASIKRIEQVLNSGLVTATGQNLFAGRFAYLNMSNLSPPEVFNETLQILFNSPRGGRLHVENLKGATGELALRLGAENAPFGVINVGDDSKLLSLCDEAGLETGDREFTGSLFQEINKPHSTVNVLIGSRKFSEGWNSWRVSTMGLMNVGTTEGAQIIQLFGRGVRLKGYHISLKRSGRLTLPQDVSRHKHMGVLETLGIFGIRANYMAQFREFLTEEGLPTNDERIEIILPVINNLGTQKLKMIRLKRTINGVSTDFGDAFKKLGPIPVLAKPDDSTDYLRRNPVVLNWYPKIQALLAPGVGEGVESQPNQTLLSPKHITFLDVDRLYFELRRFKSERGWHNLLVTREAVLDLLSDQSWYRLLIPENQLAFDSFEKVHLWSEITLALLKKYTERYYGFRKQEWEAPHLEYRDLDATDPNFTGAAEAGEDGYYRILLEQSEDAIADKLRQLKVMIQSGKLKNWDFQGIKALWFGQHLYEPLLYLANSLVEITPVPLNKGESQFVEDLKRFHESDGGFFLDKDLYLLRNMSKGRGVGFFEAGNFHPDFILWLLVGDCQHVLFLDPKGIRNIGKDDPKIQFYQTIKEIEARLADPQVILHSFIISNTASATMKRLWGINKAEMEARHIVFQQEDTDTYVQTLIETSLSNAPPSVPSAGRKTKLRRKIN